MIKSRGIKKYYIYSAVFHAALIGLIVYAGIRYKPQIQSIGSNVVVSVVSRVPGTLASIKKAIQMPVRKPSAVKAAPPVKIKSSLNYHENNKTLTGKSKHSYPKPLPTVNSNVYNSLNNMVSLNGAYGRLRQSLVRGNIHKFSGYINKITGVIMSNFNINLNKYLNYKSVIAFKISPSGGVYDIRIAKSSGSGYFDSQSVEALVLSSPLPSPPEHFMEYFNSRNAGAGVLIIFNPKKILSDE